MHLLKWYDNIFHSIHLFHLVRKKATSLLMTTNRIHFMLVCDKKHHQVEHRDEAGAFTAIIDVLFYIKYFRLTITFVRSLLLRE
jgi:hypothetical protein